MANRPQAQNSTVFFGVLCILKPDSFRALRVQSKLVTVPPPLQIKDPCSFLDCMYRMIALKPLKDIWEDVHGELLCPLEELELFLHLVCLAQLGPARPDSPSLFGD